MYAPLHRHRPAHRWTNGDLAAQLAADLGMPVDAEQRWLLDTIYAEKSPDRPASFEVAVVAPRQNLKTFTFGIAALADLFVFEVERHLWTAHHGDTLKTTFVDFRGWLSANPEYDEQVSYYEGHQDMAIVHKDTGNRIDFQSRTGKAGRGLTGVKRITLDEALYLEAQHTGAVYPTMLTRPGAQVRIASSAGLLASKQLRLIRDRGRTGKEARLAYLEYGAPLKECAAGAACLHEASTAGCALNDRELWWAANCALWCGRVPEASLEDMRNSMPPAEFAREFLSWWEDPPSEGGALDFDAWLALRDAGAERGARPVFGVDVASDRSAWLAVAWRRDDGTVQLMLANGGDPLAPQMLAGEVQRLVLEWEAPCYASVAQQGEMERELVPRVERVTSADFTAACGRFADLLTDSAVRHGNQPALNNAVRAAAWRAAGAQGEQAFQLRDHPEVGPLAAAVRALHGLTCEAEYDPLDSVG